MKHYKKTKSKAAKATKPRSRAAAKQSSADLKMKAHMPVMAGDPIPRGKGSTRRS